MPSGNAGAKAGARPRAAQTRAPCGSPPEHKMIPTASCSTTEAMHWPENGPQLPMSYLNIRAVNRGETEGNSPARLRGAPGEAEPIEDRTRARRVQSNENVTEGKLLFQMIMLPGCPLLSGLW